MPGAFSIQNADGSRTIALLDVAPTADTGQPALPVRVISQLGASAGGGAAAPEYALTDAQLRASPVQVAIASGGPSAGLTDAQLRASPVPVSGFPVTQPVSGAVSVSNLPAVQPVSGTFWPPTQPVSGTLAHQPATNTVSVTAAAGIAVTATLPAAGAGLFHIITRINIIQFNSAARAGTATPVVVTSTNMPGPTGPLAWTTPSAGAIGTQYESDIQLSSPLRTAAANVATTIVAPATASVIWRINVVYYTGP